MNTLITKVQYNNFEPGEFVEEKERSYEETIGLIESFPWSAQWEKIVIDLTNPSVTIEGSGNDFLKLAVYFNHKFVLHYLDSRQHLFTKSFVHLEDTFSQIEDFFSGSFNLEDFKMESNLMEKPLKHFVSRSFTYTIDFRRIKHFLWSTSSIQFGFSLFFIILLIAEGFNGLGIAQSVFMLVLTFFVGGGVNLVLFINYYKYTKHNTLVISKGNDVFYYGSAESPKEYIKNDIIHWKRLGSSTARNHITDFVYT